jgi:hypothetical protein
VTVKKSDVTLHFLKETARSWSNFQMVTVESLYGFCTALGTIIFVLIFLNYYLEAKSEPEPEPEPVVIAKTVKKGKRSGQKS